MDKIGHIIDKTSLDHLETCEYHNPSVCDYCGNINGRFTQNGYDYFNFLDILKKNKIEQKVSPRIKEEFDFYKKSIFPFIQSIKSYVPVAEGFNFQITDLQRKEYYAVVDETVFKVFNRLRIKDISSKEMLAYTLNILKRDVRTYWIIYLRQNYGNDMLVDWNYIQAYIEKDGLKFEDYGSLIHGLKIEGIHKDAFIEKILQDPNKKEINFLSIQNFANIDSDNLNKNILADIGKFTSILDYCIFLLFFIRRRSMKRIAYFFNLNKVIISLKLNTMVDCLKHYYGFYKEYKSSNFIGVSKHNNSKKRWMSSIRIDGKSYHLGVFDTEIQAAVMYDKKARTIGRKRVNFPQIEDEIQVIRKKLSINDVIKFFYENSEITSTEVSSRIIGTDSPPKTYYSKIKIEIVLLYLRKLYYGKEKS